MRGRTQELFQDEICFSSLIVVVERAPDSPFLAQGVAGSLRDHGVFQQTLEQYPAAVRLSTTETKGELIQMGCELGTLVRSQWPSLQQSRHPMDAGHGDTHRIARSRRVEALMTVIPGGQSAVALPCAAANRASRISRILDKGNQSGRGNSGESPQSCASNPNGLKESNCDHQR